MKDGIMWPSAAYLTALPAVPDTDEARSALAAHVFPQVFRTDFTAPGFALIQFDAAVDSHRLRGFMVDFKAALGALYRERFGRHLVFLSLARFDQQVTTKFHLDGAPADSFLMLGYEPSSVDSTLALADYSKAAHTLGLTPAQFLHDHNPMFTRGEQLLLPHATALTPFDPSRPQVLLINNSSRAFDPAAANQLGVMHQATIVQPSAQHRRVVNSAMLGTAGHENEERISAAEVRRFVATEDVASRYGA